MFLRPAKKIDYEVHLKWWSQLILGHPFFVKKPFDEKNPDATSHSHRDVDRIIGVIPLWDQFLQELDTHALNVSSRYYAQSKDLNNQLRDFFEVGCDDLPTACDLHQNKILLEEYVKNRNEENKRKFIAGVKLSISRRADPKPFSESLMIIREDSFFKAYMDSVIDPLFKDKERLAAKNPNDLRVKVLETTIQEIRSVVIDCARRYEDQYRAQRKVSQVFDYQTKSFYKSNVVAIIEKNLIEQKSLGVHKRWGTNYGKGLLNAVACIPFLGQIVGGIHYLVTGNYFWQTCTDAQQTAHTAHERARTMCISPTLKSR